MEIVIIAQMAFVFRFDMAILPTNRSRGIEKLFSKTQGKQIIES